MNDAKYIGLDVHRATISAAVLDSAGKLVMESILETQAETILQFLRGLRGSLHVTFEEGTWAAWLHDLLEEMFGSDRNRPKDYRRAVAIDAGLRNTTNDDTLRSEQRSALTKRLTEPALLEMSGYPTNHPSGTGLSKGKWLPGQAF